MVQNLLLVGIGGFCGACVRYLLGGWMTERFMLATGTSIPAGTAFVNITGSLLLAFFLAWVARQVSPPDGLKLLIGTGFFGAYTTFSTYANESIDLLRQDWRAGIGYIVLTNLLCLIGVVIGLWLAEQLWPTP